MKRLAFAAAMALRRLRRHWPAILARCLGCSIRTTPRWFRSKLPFRARVARRPLPLIQEIVAMLAADPQTDWSKVNIEALREHLVDMDNVTLHAHATSEDVDNGVRFLGDWRGLGRELHPPHGLCPRQGHERRRRMDL